LYRLGKLWVLRQPLLPESYISHGCTGKKRKISISPSFGDSHVESGVVYMVLSRGSGQPLVALAPPAGGTIRNSKDREEK
jgi:hypothetical protein